VLLMRLRGFSVGETAALLGLSYKSVEGLYTRARARVRLALGGLLAWIGLRLRRVASSRGEAAVATVAALLFAGPFWGGGAPLGNGFAHGGAHARPGAALGTAWHDPSGSPSGRGAAPGPNQWGSGERGRHAGGGPAPPPPGDHRTRVSVPLAVPAPQPVGGPDLLNTGITISYGPVQNLDPVGGVEKCMAQGGPKVSLTQDFCGN